MTHMAMIAQIVKQAEACPGMNQQATWPNCAVKLMCHMTWPPDSVTANLTCSLQCVQTPRRQGHQGLHGQTAQLIDVARVTALGPTQEAHSSHSWHAPQDPVTQLTVS